MLHTFAVLGGDARQHYLAELLTASGFTVHTFAVPELPNTAASLEESAVTSGAITGLSGLTPAHLLSLLPERAVVFGGGLGAFKTLLQRMDTPYYDLLQNTALAAQNASLTAEGALLIALQAIPLAIR